MYPESWSRKYTKPSEWCVLRDSKGQALTIMNYAFLFSCTRFTVSDVGADRIETSHVSKLWIYPITAVRITGNSTHIAYQLSHITHNIMGNCKITPKEVEKVLVDCLDSGRYSRVGKGIVQVFWCVDSVLQREPINKDSKWLTFASSSGVLENLEGSDEDFMRQHLRSVLSPQQEEQLEAKIEERVEKSLFERLSSKIRHSREG